MRARGSGRGSLAKLSVMHLDTLRRHARACHEHPRLCNVAFSSAITSDTIQCLMAISRMASFVRMSNTASCRAGIMQDVDARNKCEHDAECGTERSGLRPNRDLPRPYRTNDIIRRIMCSTLTPWRA